MEKEKPLPVGYKPGKLRPYYSSAIPPQLKALSALTKTDHLHLFIIFALAFSLRLYKLPQPPKVVFDETHFGGFANQYFHGEFFVDVHPPLGKLVYYWIGILFGWNGEFEFAKIGDVFDNNVPYVAMRAFSALSGTLTVVFAYLALRFSGCRGFVAFFGSMLVVFENSLATQSRFILLDAPLVFFTAVVVALFQKSQVLVPFSRKWYSALLGTGLALGFAISTKLTGFFTLAWVLGWATYNMWVLLGDLEVSLGAWVYHGICRAVAYIVIPLSVYCAFFAVHFDLLYKNGTGSGIMSPSFKSMLLDSDKLRNTAVDVSYGSTVTIKHHRLDTYLHSHQFPYKSGTGQQQVSMYGFDQDGNNEWVLETPGTNYDGKFDSKFRPIKDGDNVKLYHKFSHKYLRASDVRPPNSEHDYSNEVSCHGNRTDTEDINYEWRVKIVGRKPHAANELPLRKLRATESVFQLVHRGTNCVLMGHDVKLPEWGFHQNQVLCVNDPTKPNTLWYIENNNHPVLDNDKFYPRVELPPLPFWKKMLEYHHSMYRRNKGFTEKHDYASVPFTWPFVVRGINYFTNGHGHEKLTDEPGSHIYFLGNMAVYYFGFVVVVIFSLKFAVYVVQCFNPFVPADNSVHVTNYYIQMLQYVSGWALHYFPYTRMTRQLFAHHYLPSVFFLTLAIAQFVELQIQLRPRAGKVLMAVVYGATVYCFVKFAPLIYGSAWTVQQCQHAKWYPSWDFDCMAYSQ